MGAAPQRLYLFRDDLAGVPARSLPAPYRLRYFQPGDAVHWLGIHKAADQLTALDARLFERQFGGAHALLSRRQAYALDGNVPVGTVTAWQGLWKGREIGRVHWLAVVPEHQGRGLGAALFSEACQRLLSEGFQQAYLVTSPLRKDALALYERMGFVVAHPSPPS